MFPTDMLHRPRLLAGLLAFACLAALSTGLFVQHILGYGRVRARQISAERLASRILAFDRMSSPRAEMQHLQGRDFIAEDNPHRTVQHPSKRPVPPVFSLDGGQCGICRDH